MIRRILVPVDGSDVSVRAAGRAAEIAALCGAEIGLLYVPLLPEDTDDEKIASGSWLSDLATFSVKKKSRCVMDKASAAIKGVNFSRTVKHGNPSEIITAEANGEGFDLVVIGGRGVGVMEGLLLGSVSQTVLEGVQCPVMVVK
jgi:nucleotide-binding universal stress UspA family protein